MGCSFLKIFKCCDCSGENYVDNYTLSPVKNNVINIYIFFLKKKITSEKKSPSKRSPKEKLKIDLLKVEKDLIDSFCCK